jgi:hypothetical protein
VRGVTGFLQDQLGPVQPWLLLPGGFCGFVQPMALGAGGCRGPGGVQLYCTVRAQAAALRPCRQLSGCVLASSFCGNQQVQWCSVESFG